ncbi:uncharacterized protein RCC_11522 [Ramularia collo-cygni]|uniref:NAD dependent epimerase/dehydratase n=1 Tax=Ramularia collo-cygni TaxID=112498 RepID=A0A2D3VSW8_9PEZI|nr:uncharacterized protein RCC_11522 [Ramularia collo-cygni]CZT25853.1 uncharacterized protein RCC_11522 [Ramularia collo-cygni]
MGAKASRPKPGARLQVIGAGLPRTGTASFAAALSLLFDGPVYHGGTQTLVNTDDTQVKAWIDILAHTPYKTPADREYVMGKLQTLTQGFIATADAPLGQFVEELMEIYPDAQVVCTVRDRDAWAKSLDETAKPSLQPFLGLLVYWVPVLTHFPKYIQHLQAGRWGELYSQPGEKWSVGKDVWDRHMAYLERTVPKDKIVYFDVREGWQPLYKALNVQVPVDVEFPRINDGKAMEDFAKTQVQRGLKHWVVRLLGCATAVAVIWQYFKV